MAAATVRADYDQLNQLASTFGKNADSCKQTLQNIKSNMDTLQGGDWIGQGANAFFQEMDNSVLPTLQRLVNALSSAQTSVSQISSIMKDAEEQAAKVLQGPGAAGGSIGGATSGALGGALGGLGGTFGGAASGALGGGAGGFSGGGLGGGLGDTAFGGGGGAAPGSGGSSSFPGSLGGSPSDQITQLTNEATQAVSSLSDVPTDALNGAVNQLGNLASQYNGIVPPGFQPNGNGLGPLLSAIGSPDANNVAQQITQPFSGGGGAPSGGGGSSSGGGFSGGGGGGPSGGGGGGGAPSGGGVSGQAMQGFSDQALTALMNNPNLPPSDRMLAMAIETLRRDPNAFGGALKQFVDQALGQGATQQAANAAGGGISALAGAAGISSGGQPPTGTSDAIRSLANQYNGIMQGGGASVPTGQAVVSPVGPAGITPPASPPPASAGGAILNLVQQFIQTVNAVLPK